MTIDKLRRKAEIMERFAPYARTVAQSIAFSKAFDRTMDRLKSLPVSSSEKIPSFEALMRAAESQVKMWRARVAMEGN